MDVIAGNLDLSVAFLGEVSGFIDQGNLFVLGISGHRPVRGIPTLDSQGFTGLNQVVNMHSLLVPKNMPAEQYAALRDLVVTAAKSGKVQKSYSVDYCEPSRLTLPATQQWFDSQVVLWKRLSQAVNIDK
jgi:tripartite-type tricarboxylate transporter receptor subunit TctC